MSTPLRELLHDLLFDPPARAAFTADPAGFLGDHGWDGLDGQDVEAALSAYVEELPPDAGARLATVVSADGDDTNGLAGAIAGLEAAVSAIDGDVEPAVAADQLDPGATLDDLEAAGDALDELDLEQESELDELSFGGHDDVGAAEATSEPADELDEMTPEFLLDDDGLDTAADAGEPWVDAGEPSIDADEPDDDAID